MMLTTHRMRRIQVVLMLNFLLFREEFLCPPAFPLLTGLAFGFSTPFLLPSSFSPLLTLFLRVSKVLQFRSYQRHQRYQR